MAIASVGDGSQTATIDTEHTLDTETTAGVYVLCVDLANLANGDTVVLRIKTKCRSGGTSRLAWLASYSHVQVCNNVYSVPVVADIECLATLEQTDGTGRAFPWSLIKVG